MSFTLSARVTRLSLSSSSLSLPDSCCLAACLSCSCTAVFRLMSRWGFSYVENLTWVLLAPNHSILELPCGNVQRSHITLYIFRKDGELVAGVVLGWCAMCVRARASV